MENLKPSTSMMEEEPMKMTCKGCQKAYAFKSIVQHVQKSKCSTSYSQEEVSKLKERSKEISDSRKKLWNQQNKDKVNKKRHETYEKNQAKIKKKRRDQYDKSRRAEIYQIKKIAIAARYQKFKAERAKRYDKKRRAGKYKEVMKETKEKRKEMNRMKESDEGDTFKHMVYNKIFLEVINHTIDDLLDIAYDTINDDCYDQARDVTFNSDLWIQEAINFASNSNENLEDMTDSRLSEILEKALDKRLNEDIHPIIRKAAENMFKREWKHAFKSNYLVEDEYSCTQSQVDKRAINKVFARVFKQKFIPIYKSAKVKYKYIEDQRDKFYETDGKEGEYLFPGKNDYTFLKDEVDSSTGTLKEDVRKIIDDELDTAICKKFIPFKEDIYWKMVCANSRPFRWASMKLEEIKKTFAGSQQIEEVTSIVQDAHAKVEEIYKEYKDEIDKTYQNCNISIHYYAFSKVIDSYPKLDFEDEAHSKKANCCPLVPNQCHGWTQCCGCLEQGIDDNFGILIEKVWTQLNVEEQKCACYQCTYKGKCEKCPDCNRSHTYSWNYDHCDKIIRQRLKQRPYRTC